MNEQEQTEFYSPFAHIPGRYEWCRIHSPSHGSFDTFIVIDDRTDTSVTVYVNNDNGEAFMADRYPESRCFRVPGAHLAIRSTRNGRRVDAGLVASVGPVGEASMVFEAGDEAPLKEAGDGGEDYEVWGSRWSCTGVDMEVKASVTGKVIRNCSSEELTCSGIITMGSYGTIRQLDQS